MEGVSELLPPLEPGVYEALRASIDRDGVLVRVVVSAGPACAGEVVDGVHRLRACAELGRECPRDERRFESELEFRLFQLDANLRRRQLSPAAQIQLGQALQPLLAEQAARRKAQAKGMRRGEKSLPPSSAGESGETREQVARLVGLGRTSYTKGAAVLAQGSPELVRAFEAGRESINSAHRRLRLEQRRAEVAQIAAQLRAAPPTPPDGRYEVVACDPPWPYDDEKLPYPPMSLEAIAELRVPELLAEDAYLWLWTTNAFLFEAKQIAVGSWGLRYRIMLTWAKDRVGTGGPLRGQTEHCLLLSRGDPVATPSNQSTLLVAPVREHSRKPDEFYALVESLCPGRQLEMFARERRPGWQAWGAEPDRFGADAQ